MTGRAPSNRPAFTTKLTTEWLPSVPGLEDRLVSGVRVADFGAGQGWSTQALARAYPRSELVGVDLDAASIRDARALLPADLEGRVCFETAAADELEGSS